MEKIKPRPTVIAFPLLKRINPPNPKTHGEINNRDADPSRKTSLLSQNISKIVMENTHVFNEDDSPWVTLLKICNLIKIK